MPTETATGRAAGLGFPVLLIVRVLTVVNDNLARWLVIGLGKRAAVLAVGTIFYVVPFILFAWLAGWLADRFAKRSIVVGGKFAEILIAVVTAAVVGWGAASGPVISSMPLGLWLLLGTTGLFALQTTLLNPSLLGTIPETVPTARLSAANGVFALVSLAATLVGMAAGNWLADSTWLSPEADPERPLPAWLAALPWGHVAPAAAGLLGVATVGWLVSLLLPRIAAADPRSPFPANAVAATVRDIGRLVKAPRLAGAAAGIVYFWALGAVVQLNVDQYAFESGASLQQEVVPLLFALVAGIGAGSLLAGRLSKRGIDAGSKVDLGLVPVGGVVMAVACGALALSASDVFGGSRLGLLPPIGWLALLGIGAGLFDVPLEAYLQEQSPPERRGTVLASTNMLVFSGMLLASAAYYQLRVPVPPLDPQAVARPWLSARAIFGIFAVMSVMATGVAVWAAPRATLRLFVGSIVHATWRFRVRDEDRVPQSGPLVIVANHLSWLDGFLLPLAAPRPVRMVVYGPNIRGTFLNMLAEQWRFILFDPKPKSIGRALKAIQGGLADGDCIGIFCEGGISRTGQILGFKRGLEWLLERVESPILPASIDGMWGSLLSYSEGRYFTKWPRGLRRRVTLTFGPPLPVGTSTDMARLALQERGSRGLRRGVSSPPRGSARRLARSRGRAPRHPRHPRRPVAGHRGDGDRCRGSTRRARPRTPRRPGHDLAGPREPGRGPRRRGVRRSEPRRPSGSGGDADRRGRRSPLGPPCGRAVWRTPWHRASRGLLPPRGKLPGGDEHPAGPLGRRLRGQLQARHARPRLERRRRLAAGIAAAALGPPLARGRGNSR